LIPAKPLPAAVRCTVAPNALAIMKRSVIGGTCGMIKMSL
jgi:hypothetical protein